ncbi:toll/interleukin-1 receptor domain-containing adapter protein [Misgurnus anguillicaudatus]|uniref:toll/interleukin-1 receptor domain-containing adapter protein n=1 Tax=Misgurnus anguillicaudatus TaxID=75329 RepID=UPI003CCFD8A0
MEENRASGIMGWFRQHFGKQRNNLDQCKRSQKDIPTISNSSCSSANSEYTSSASSKSSSFPSQKPLPTVLFSTFRSTLRYDVCLCHSDKDIEQAQGLASFLEDPSKGLRCYLQERDCPLGGAVFSELLQALHDSHCWVLLITPNFLKDDCCSYQMHQALSEGPMSQRIIPTVLNLPRSELPQELRFVFSVDLNRNKEFGYIQIYNTVLNYLTERLEKEESCNVSQSDN